MPRSPIELSEEIIQAIDLELEVQDEGYNNPLIKLADAQWEALKHNPETSKKVCEAFILAGWAGIEIMNSPGIALIRHSD